MLLVENMAIFYRLNHLVFPEYLCFKTNPKPVCNRKEAAQALPRYVYKKFRAERMFSVISRGTSQTVKRSECQSRVVGPVQRTAQSSFVDILYNQNERTRACLPDQTFQYWGIKVLPLFQK